MTKLTQEETEMEADEALDIEYQAYLKSVSVQSISIAFELMIPC